MTFKVTIASLLSRLDKKLSKIRVIFVLDIGCFTTETQFVLLFTSFW